MIEQDTESPSEQVEQALHAAEEAAKGNSFNRAVAAAVALMAIVAATIGSLQETESADALGLKNESVLLQARASDQWSFFQAKSIKKNAYQIAAEQTAAAGLDGAKYAATAKRYADEEAEIQGQAKQLEESSHAKWDESAAHTHRQHVLTFSETLLHVATAISSLAILTRRRPALYAALALSSIGVAVAVAAYLV